MKGALPRLRACADRCRSRLATSGWVECSSYHRAQGFLGERYRQDAHGGRTALIVRPGEALTGEVALVGGPSVAAARQEGFQDLRVAREDQRRVVDARGVELRLEVDLRRGSAGHADRRAIEILDRADR